MGLTVHFEVLNQLGTPMMYSSSLATRPAAGIQGRIFFRTDSPYGIYRDNGTTWDQIAGSGGGGISGSGTATQIAYWDSSSSIASSANLYWDNTNGRLGINNASPGASIDAHGTGGTIIQSNSTTLGNSLMSFQLQGTGKWQIGNVYSAGTNYFRIYDQLNSSERLKIQNTGQIDQLGWLTTTNTITGITGTTPSALPNSAFSNNYTFNTGISTSASVNTIGLLMDNNLNYSGANTINATSYNASGLYRNVLNFGSAGASVTYTQASSNIRALVNDQIQYLQNGANSGTISHYANIQILGDQKTGAGLTTFTNRYGILINDYNEFAAGNTYTNRWGIYQAGLNESNFFAGKVGIGSGYTPGTYFLDVYGTANVRGVFRTSDIVFSRGNPGATQTLIIGESTGSNTITGGNNHCIGFQSGSSLSSGSNNTFFGKSAGSAVTTGSQNTIIGTSNGAAINTGVGNVSIGYNLLSGGNNNLCVAIGNESLKLIVGDANTSIGSSSFRESTSGANNVGLGYEAGRLIIAGTGNIICNNSVFLGALTRANANNETNQIVIGYDARGAGSNTATLGNTSITKTILRGTLNAANLPTSPAGLVAGDIWNNLGILNIV